MALGDVGDGVLGFGGNRCLHKRESFVVGTGSRLRKHAGHCIGRSRDVWSWAKPHGACTLRRRVRDRGSMSWHVAALAIALEGDRNI